MTRFHAARATATRALRIRLFIIISSSIIVAVAVIIVIRRRCLLMIVTVPTSTPLLTFIVIRALTRFTF